jgi:hypothetical protein
MDHTYRVKIIKTDAEIQLCWEVAFLLRPHLNNSFVVRSFFQNPNIQQHHLVYHDF